MSEHDEKAEERVEDLDVPESESEDVKGGLLPAIQQIKPEVPEGRHRQQVQPGRRRFGDGSV